MIKRIFRGVAAVLICALALGALTSAMQLIGNGIAWSGKSDEPEKLPPLRGEMYMSKKKNKRRWNRRHEFQWHKKTESRKGHPSYIFGISGKKFRFFCFTHSDTTDGAENIKLKHNIDKNDNRDCYIRPVAQIDNKENFEAPKKKYRIHDKDKTLLAKLLAMFR